MELKIHVKVLPGDKCWVNNYRLKPPQWERGTCRITQVGIISDSNYKTQYHVELDRKSNGSSRFYRNGGAPLFLTVGNDGINKI